MDTHSEKKNSSKLGIKIAQLCSVTEKKKLLWLHSGTWEPIFKKINKFLHDLHTYNNHLIKQAESMQALRSKEADKDIFSRDINIFTIQNRANSQKESKYYVLLCQKLDLWNLGIF